MSNKINTISEILAISSKEGGGHKKNSWLNYASLNPPVIEGLPLQEVTLNGEVVQLPALVLMAFENAYIPSHPMTIAEVTRLAKLGLVNAQQEGGSVSTVKDNSPLPGHVLTYDDFRDSFFTLFGKLAVKELYGRLEVLDLSKATKTDLVKFIEDIKLSIINEESLAKLAVLWEKEKVSQTLLSEVQKFFTSDLFILREKVVTGTLLSKESARGLKEWADAHKLSARAKVADVTSKDGGLFLDKKKSDDIFGEDKFIATIGIGEVWDASTNISDNTQA